MLVVYVGGDANDAVRPAETRLFGVGSGDEFKDRIRPVDVASDGMLSGPHALGQGLADDGHGLAILVIEVVEVASL